ncbi:MAG: PAS domain S-box protein [Acetobacteraceae bacterium]|nr:PAS domain S-box protein [Acetobacteraceae bacterium]
MTNGLARLWQIIPRSSQGHFTAGSALGSRVATRLLWLVVAVAVPLLGLSTLAIWRVHESQQAVQEAALIEQARSMAQLTDREFERVETALRALATSASLAQGDLVGVETEMRAMSTRFGDAPIALIGNDGTKLLATSWPPGARYKDVPGGMASLAALASGQVTITDLIPGVHNGGTNTAVAVPVFGQGETSRPRYAFAAGIPPERFASVLHLAPAGDEPGWVASIVDRNATVVARSTDQTARQGTQLSEAMSDHLNTQPQGIVRANVTMEGVPAIFAFAHAPISHYAVVLGMPDAVFQAPLRADMFRAIGIGGLLVTAGLLSAFLLAQRLVGSLRAVGEAQGGAPVRTGLREVDDLAARLAGMAAERDRVQRAMQYQLTLLRAVTESTTEAIFLTDPQGRVTYANPEAERLSGWRQEELIGQVLHDVVQYRRPDGRPYHAWESPLMHVLRTGGAKVGHEEVFYRRDGAAVDVDCSSAPVVVQDSIVGAVIMVRDITNRKRTDKVLRDNEARLRDLVHTLDLAALLVRDPDGHITFWSQGCEKLYGWTVAEAVGQASHTLLRTVFPNGQAAVEAALARDGTWHGDLIHTCRDGRQIVVAGHWVLRRDAAGRSLAVTESLTDVTALREAEADLHRLNSELEQRVAEEVAAREAAQVRAVHAERMQALGQLAGGIAHDFNNVLQAVASGAALIERRPNDLSAVRRLAHVIIDAAGRGASITRRMLAFASRSDLEAETIAPATLLEGLREICTYTLGAAIRVQLELRPDLPNLLADKGQLETALVNLATNARDAMPDGGVMTLAAAAEQVGPQADDHRAGLAPGSYIRLAVHDTGVGMERHVLARVAEPFFTTKGVGKGTGLGLSMVKGFVEQSGGGLAIESTPGEGTVVTLWLPQAATDRGMEGTMALDRGETGMIGGGGGGAGRVLLVDDDSLVRDTLAAQLEDAGYAVLPAADGTEAIALLEQGRPVDVMVTDLSMPGMSGLTLIRAAQVLRPGLPAILLTGYSGDAAALAVGGAVSGSYSLVRKPVPGAQLIGRVAAMLEAVT